MTAPECNGKDLADLFQHFHKDFERTRILTLQIVVLPALITHFVLQ